MPRPRYRLSEHEERAVRLKLLSSKMACHMPADNVPRRARRKLLRAGMFAVAIKRRTIDSLSIVAPKNWCEKRFNWARLPCGPQLSRLLIPRGCGVRGSGDDLKNFFYNL